MSMRWPARNTFKESVRRGKELPGRHRWEIQCAHCGEWFPQSHVQVDHIVPCGSLKCAEDLPGFVERLFCEEEGFQALCKPCHNKKTCD